MNISFLKAALSDHNIGAIAPSSRYAIRNIVSKLKPEYKYIVEFGAGDGVVTREILNILPPDGKLIAIETNSDFVTTLRRIKDSRLKVLNRSVVDIVEDFSKLEIPHVDAFISGIPFSFFASAERNKIIRYTHAGLTPGGSFIVYQFTPLVRPLLKEYFSKVHTTYELRNIFPYFIMTAEK